MFIAPTIQAFRRLGKLPRAVRGFDHMKRIGGRPVIVLARSLCDKSVPQEGQQDSQALHSDSKYVGDTRGGLRCGTGECWDEVGHYIGEWVSDIREGFGTFSYANGIVYEGAFADDVPNGLGKLTWPDGTVYEGKFGNGYLQDDTRSLSVHGICKEGKRVSG